MTVSRLLRLAFPILGLTVLLGACGDQTVSTTTVPQSTTSTSTTAFVPSEVEIPKSGIVKFEPGTTYVAGGFWVPLSFTTDVDGGWWSRGATELWVYVEYHEGAESGWDLDVSVIAPDPTRTPGDLVSDIVGDNRLEVITDPKATTVAGHDAIVLDVEGVGTIDDCATRADGGNSRFSQLSPGFFMMRHFDEVISGGVVYGVRACRAARIWLVDVVGETIVVIAATLDGERFDDLIPIADQLVGGIEFNA